MTRLERGTKAKDRGEAGEDTRRFLFCTGKTGLASLVIAAVDQVEWPGKADEFTDTRGKKLPARNLMRVLTYFLATGRDDPAGVGPETEADPNVWLLSEGPCPDSQLLREFRIAHTVALKQCVAQLFADAVRIRFGDETHEPPLADSCVSLLLDRWLEPLCAGICEQAEPREPAPLPASPRQAA